MIDRKCAVCGEPSFEPLIPLVGEPALSLLACSQCKVRLGRTFGGKPVEAAVSWNDGGLLVSVVDATACVLVNSRILASELSRCAQGQNAPYYPFAVLLCTHINKNLRDLHREQAK